MGFGMHKILGLSLFCFLSYCMPVLEAQMYEIPQPDFAEPIPNITATAGREVSLPCIVNDIQKYKVAWIHTNRYTLLTMGSRVITKSNRHKVSHNSKGTWWLHINNVQEKDRGQYMCQVNTIPMMTQVGYIEVVVPPFLDETATSSDTEVHEGNDVCLRCEAKGSPEPEVTWRREDGKDIVNGKHKTPRVKGKFLNITNVSRLHMGAYHCISTNGVPPSLSKRILLAVSFTPMIWIPNQLIGAPIAADVFLQCNLETHPRSVTYWVREGGVMVLTNNKYITEIAPIVHYKFQLKLQIRNLQPDDFGTYTCVAKNSLGETEGTIRLYEISSSSSHENMDVFNSKSKKWRNQKELNPFIKYGGEDIPSGDSADDYSRADDNIFSRSFYTKGSSSAGKKSTHSPHLLSNILCLVSMHLGWAAIAIIFRLTI